MSQQPTSVLTHEVHLEIPTPTEEFDMICSICQDGIGSVRADSTTERLHALPCTHVFGSICILRWLEDAPHPHCPHCRRSMVHRGCGHLIMPHDAENAPPRVSQEETPDQCVRCRGESEVAQTLRQEYDRLQAKEAALRGMQANLPTALGGMAPKSLGDVEERIAQLRRRFAQFSERAWRNVARTERRDTW